MSALSRLGMGCGLFIAAYYGVFALGGPQWSADALLVVPAGTAAGLHLWRGGRERGRSRWFWSVAALGPILWALGTALWALAEHWGYHPASSSAPHLKGFPIFFDLVFVGFYVPLVCAVAMRPHPRAARPDLAAMTDVGLLVVAAAFVFLRLVFLPVTDPIDRPWRWVFGLLAFVLVAWGAASWRWVRDASWSRTYGFFALFALLYVVLDSLATGFGNTTLSPGGPADLAWILPFFVLGAGAIPKPPRLREVSSTGVVLLAGAGPILLETVLLKTLAPLLGLSYQANLPLLVSVMAVIGVGCGVRLVLQERSHARLADEANWRAEEARRAGRLATLVSLSATAVEELQGATTEVVRWAQAASPFMGERAVRVVEQAQRAQLIAENLTASLRLAPETQRQDVDVGQLLEDTVRAALEEGLGLRVSVERRARLPPVWGDPGALALAFQHLIRNASQASPGGHLRVQTELGDGRIMLRFHDDGPGVPRDIRQRIFDPFFTTRPVGEGVGLGLTHVHFVARDHGGSVVLEERERGACLALELPIRERRRGEAVHAPLPLVIAILAAATVAVGLVVLPESSLRATWSTFFQSASAIGASLSLAYAGVKRVGRARLFWFLLAAGPASFCLAALARGPREGVGALVLAGATDLLWASALLARPDRRIGSGFSRRHPLFGAAVLSLFACGDAYFVLLPAQLAVSDPLVRAQGAILHGAPRLGLVLWAFVLASRAASPYWRALFGRLALALAGWAVGQTVADAFAALPDYAGGTLSDLGWIVPYVLLAALIAAESWRGRGEDVPGPSIAPGETRPPVAALLGSLGTLALFDALAGSGHSALDAARHSLTLMTTALVGVLLALSEHLPRIRRPSAGSSEEHAGPTDEPSSRLLRTVRTALYELSGHLSGITTLSRLVLAQSDASPRIRGDVDRARSRGELASRIVHNLMAALPGSESTSEAFPLNRLVEEVALLRGADLAEEGIRFEKWLTPREPGSGLDPAAIRQVLLRCVDQAAMALRGAGRAGTIELTTAVEKDDAVVRIRYDGPGLPRALLKQLEGAIPPLGGRVDAELGLALGQQVLARDGGSLIARNRSEGGAEFTLRIPLARAPQDPGP